jgi:hypothetical protein
MMDPDVLKLAQVLAVVGTFGAVLAFLGFVGRAVLSRTQPKQAPPDWAAPRIDEDRFARLENAVDAIAIEVERMSEAQRFSAKLMSERLPASPPDKQ